MVFSKQQHAVSRLIDRLADSSYRELFIAWVFFNIAFAFIYLTLSYIPGEGPTIEGEGLARFFNSAYFTIVTTMTIGYGDIVPLGISKVVVGFQSIFAFVILVAFTSRLVSRKQDIAIASMHQMADANALRHLREGFFTIRRDIERAIKELTEGVDIHAHGWELIETGSRYGQVLVVEVEDILRETGRSNIAVNRRREEVLFESIYRTTVRFLHFFDIVVAKRQELPHASISALEATVTFLNGIAAVAESWHTHSPYQNKTEYDERVIESVQAVLKRIDDLR